MVVGKLPLVPRYRQVVRFVPLAMGRPVWVDDPHFNLEYHVRRTALPAPGGEQELRNLVGRVMSQHLDRAKPLWEMWIAEGLGAGRWALVSKVHHCMVDGVSGTDLLTVILDTERDPEPPRADDWHAGARAERRPPAGRRARRAHGQPLRGAAGDAGRACARRASSPRHLEDTARGLVGMRGLVRRTPPSSLNGPIGPHRRWSWARSQLSDVKAIRGALGGTVNDVVLACITNGFRRLLLARGESIDRVVRTMVPVSVRSPGERGTYNNRVSAMFAELPVGIEDPRERLDSIRAQMEGLKESQQAVAGEVLTSLSGFAPPMLLALGERVATRVPQRNVNTVTTNVPGPQFPLYAAGRRLLEAFPYVPLGGRVRVGVAIFSYDGALNFGVTGDYDSAADVGVLCDGIEEGMSRARQARGADARDRTPRKVPRPAKPKVAAKARPKRRRSRPGPDHRAERRVTKPALPLSVVALVLAGCGGGNGDRATQTQAPATPAERSAVAELKYCFEGAGALTAKPGRPIPEVGEVAAAPDVKDAKPVLVIGWPDTKHVRKRLLRDERCCGRERGGRARRKADRAERKSPDRARPRGSAVVRRGAARLRLPASGAILMRSGRAAAAASPRFAASALILLMALGGSAASRSAASSVSVPNPAEARSAAAAPLVGMRPPSRLIQSSLASNGLAMSPSSVDPHGPLMTHAG